MARRLSKEEKRWIDQLARTIDQQPETIEVIIDKESPCLKIIDCNSGYEFGTVQHNWESTEEQKIREQYPTVF